MSRAMPSDVKAKFDEIKPGPRGVLMELRALIYDCAQEVETPVTECLKWGQPSYLAPKGSTLRLGVTKAGSAAIYAHCQSSVISSFAEQFGDDFEIEGNRAVVLDTLAPEERDKLRLLVLHGLQYKLRR